MSVQESAGQPKGSMRTPLGRVRYRGAAHSGTGDFWRQRVTAVGGLLLTIPVIVILISLLGRNHAAAIQILSSPLVAIILILYILTTCWHMKIGMQVIIEDYVHGDNVKLASILANNFFCVAVALSAIYAVVKLSSGV